MKIAILDDYQNVALSIADWSAVAKRADITVFNDHIDQTDALIERLLPFDVICVMRERTPLRRDIIERLPRLRFIASTGPRNISIDMAAANERGISPTTAPSAHDQIGNALRQARPRDDLRKGVRGAWDKVGRLEHNCIAMAERRLQSSRREWRLENSKA